MIEVGLQNIRVSLRGGGGAEATGAAFFRLLGISSETSLRLSLSEAAWQWAQIELFSVSMNDVADADELTGSFAERVRQGFERASLTLAECERAGLEQWRAGGREADVFIGGWLANDQFDLEIPAIFLSECARLGLSISVCTND